MMCFLHIGFLHIVKFLDLRHSVVTVPMVFSTRSPTTQPHMPRFTIIVRTKCSRFACYTGLIASSECAIGVVSFLAFHRRVTLRTNYLKSVFFGSGEHVTMSKCDTSAAIVSVPAMIEPNEPLIYRSSG